MVLGRRTPDPRLGGDVEDDVNPPGGPIDRGRVGHVAPDRLDLEPGQLGVIPSGQAPDGVPPGDQLADDRPGRGSRRRR